MNQTKISQKRFWSKWAAAGAVENLSQVKSRISRQANPQFKRPASEKVVTHESNFPIQPKDIKTLGVHFFDAFDNSETEVSAKWLVRFAQKQGGWFPFTFDEIEAYYNKGGYKGFWFNRLVNAELTRRNPWSESYYAGGGWIINEDGLYFFTEDFIRRCHKSSPMNSQKSEVEKKQTYMFQCLNGHYGEIVAGSDLEERAKAREAEGYLDAIILQFDECPDCLSEANERRLRQDLW